MQVFYICSLIKLNHWFSKKKKNSEENKVANIINKIYSLYILF